MSRILGWFLNNKKVFLRVDLNVKVINKKITDDFKLNSILPTLDLLLEKKAVIILAAHLGRPKDEESDLSTEVFIDWFKNKNYKITFAKNLEIAHNLVNIAESGEIILLENLRFFKAETEPDIEFAQILKSLAEFYVNDAFGVLHRNNTSVTLLPMLYQENKKSIGLLIEKELKHLSKLRDNPERPFLLILGGAKIKTKLPVLENLANKIDILFLCPAIVFTFLKAQNISVGNSLVDDSQLTEAKKILDKYKELKIGVVEPADFLVSHSPEQQQNKLNLESELFYTQSQEIPSGDFGISFGPKTLEIFKEKIKKAKTIFLNGPSGFFEEPETLDNFKDLLQAIAQSNAYSTVGGGESVAAVNYFGLSKSINFLSTGGGATLEYLSGKDLIGLKYI